MEFDHGLREYGWKIAASTQAHAYTFPAIVKLLPKGKLNILDAGCGNGAIAGKLSMLGHEVTAIDLSEDGIQIARQTWKNVQFEVASVYDDLQALVGQIDVVLSSEVIEHLYYPRQYLKNMYSLLRPGGYIILTTPYHGYLKNLALSLFDHWDKHHTVDWEGGHIKFFSVKSLHKMLVDVGFVDIVFNNAGRLPWLWKSMVCRGKKVQAK